MDINLCARRAIRKRVWDEMEEEAEGKEKEEGEKNRLNLKVTTVND